MGPRGPKVSLFLSGLGRRLGESATARLLLMGVVVSHQGGEVPTLFKSLSRPDDCRLKGQRDSLVDHVQIVFMSILNALSLTVKVVGGTSKPADHVVWGNDDPVP